MGVTDNSSSQKTCDLYAGIDPITGCDHQRCALILFRCFIERGIQERTSKILALSHNTSEGNSGAMYVKSMHKDADFLTGLSFAVRVMAALDRYDLTIGRTDNDPLSLWSAPWRIAVELQKKEKQQPP
jgi:hypothetical protein